MRAKFKFGSLDQCTKMVNESDKSDKCLVCLVVGQIASRSILREY